MEEAVAVAGGGERPQPLRGARLGPPVQPAALLQGDQRGDLDQVPLQKVSEVVCKERKAKNMSERERPILDCSRTSSNRVGVVIT